MARIWYTGNLGRMTLAPGPPTNRTSVQPISGNTARSLSLPHNEAVIQVCELAMALNQSEKLDCSLMLQAIFLNYVHFFIYHDLIPLFHLL